MLTDSNFSKVYWAHFISLEKEFINTLTYVSLDTDNYLTYSETYAKLILEIGSEVDIILKVYCKLLKPTFTGTRIGDYRSLIKMKKPNFCKQIVSVKSTDIILQPWENWNKERPYWWTAYNKIKHDRTGSGSIESVTKEYFKFANLKYTILALAGLYQVLIYIYYTIATTEGKRVLVPLPGSRLLQLVGDIWDNIDFFGDYAFYIDNNGGLIMESGSIHY
ncbi:hypothetical protein [Caproicibacter fermentans]|uniref:Uncharacterized protein n=1 Tax=Caproicibacter fermentans TaxID=2576756 RepID=A0A7G8TBH6_9FIRM|nr:hypothetical protein [Caproicibacter fermentans]QNK40967.1 hypothetical protein HCR03_01165 [Caproicibacter fermentans]